MNIKADKNKLQEIDDKYQQFNSSINIEQDDILKYISSKDNTLPVLYITMNKDKFISYHLPEFNIKTSHRVKQVSQETQKEFQDLITKAVNLIGKEMRKIDIKD